MVLFVAREHAAPAKALLEREGERVFEIGAVEKSSGEPDAVIV
jgi:phosphoribosylaminoimidazole (AIR) synthetase